MPQPNEKVFDSNAQRQKAYRERKRRGEVKPQAEPEPTFTPRPPPSPRITLDEYVQEAIEGAEHHHAATSLQANLSTTTLAERIERSESYARWRYLSYLSGEVLSL